MKLQTLIQITVLAGAIGATSALLASGREEEGKLALPPVANAKWQSECSACHMAYHPGLLPERSWRKMMAGLDKHFGENASLDPRTAQEITDFLAANSADRGENRLSAKIARSIPASATPLRISDTPYFVGEHDEIAAQTWKRKSIGSPANCGACHKTADKGDFSEHNISIPRLQ